MSAQEVDKMLKEKQAKLNAERSTQPKQQESAGEGEDRSAKFSEVVVEGDLATFRTTKSLKRGARGRKNDDVAIIEFTYNYAGVDRSSLIKAASNPRGLTLFVKDWIASGESPYGELHGGENYITVHAATAIAALHDSQKGKKTPVSVSKRMDLEAARLSASDQDKAEVRLAKAKERLEFCQGMVRNLETLGIPVGEETRTALADAEAEVNKAKAESAKAA